MPNELKPCPFCGGTAKLYNQKVVGGYDYSYVICKSCGIRTQKYEVSTEYCAKDKATEDWDRRATNTHGKWEKVKYIEGCLNSYQHTCGCCGKSYFDNNVNDYPFCPLCGAKMDGERRSE